MHEPDPTEPDPTEPDRTEPDTVGPGPSRPATGVSDATDPGPSVPVDLSALPQVDALLHLPDAASAVDRFGRAPVTDAIRAAIDLIRAQARQGVAVPAPEEILAAAILEISRRRSLRLHRVINATGVILHTNLGRAPLSAAARDAVVAAAGYTTLEYDLAAGVRGSRTRDVGALAAEVSGSEAATVVNNGAAALMLVLATLSHRRETVVSRGELIEIGGSYRLPDIMDASGAILREVGTTNRTRTADYRAVVGEDTGLILKVHQSNYAMVGFTEGAPADELAALGRESGVPFVYDVGSGLIEEQEGPLLGEPSVRDAVAAGADLVIYSGDKLLGGPQAGIIAGRADLVAACTKHPLARAFRIDKLQRAALEATLDAHLRSDGVPTDVPTWAMLAAEPEVLAIRAEALAGAIGRGWRAQPSAAVVGGGSLPGVELASWCVRLDRDDASAVAAALRAQDPPVIARVEGGSVILDLRTIPPSQDELVAGLVRDALSTSGTTDPGAS